MEHKSHGRAVGGPSCDVGARSAAALGGRKLGAGRLLREGRPLSQPEKFAFTIIGPITTSP